MNGCRNKITTFAKEKKKSDNHPHFLAQEYNTRQNELENATSFRNCTNRTQTEQNYYDVVCGDKRNHHIAHDPTCKRGRYYKLNKLYNDIERKKREIQKLQMELGAGSSLLDAAIKEKFGTNFTPPMPPERHHYQHPAPMNHSAIPYDQYWHNPQYFHQWTWRHNHYYAQPSMVTAPTNIQQIADTGVPALHELLDDSELENL